MADEPTCGKGLAEHSALPAKLAELIGSVADNLEIHMKALDPSDPNAMKEREAYESLTGQHRQIASLLRNKSRGSPPRHPERGGWVGVSERISNYEKHGLCHGLRISRSFRSLTPTRPALRMTRGARSSGSGTTAV